MGRTRTNCQDDSDKVAGLSESSGSTLATGGHISQQTPPHRIRRIRRLEASRLAVFFENNRQQAGSLSHGLMQMPLWLNATGGTKDAEYDLISQRRIHRSRELGGGPDRLQTRCAADNRVNLKSPYHPAGGGRGGSSRMATGPGAFAGSGGRNRRQLGCSEVHGIDRGTFSLNFGRFPALRQAPALRGEDSGMRRQKEYKHRPRHRKAADEVHRRLRKGIQRKLRAERSDIPLILPARTWSSTGFSAIGQIYAKLVPLREVAAFARTRAKAQGIRGRKQPSEGVQSPFYAETTAAISFRPKGA